MGSKPTTGIGFGIVKSPVRSRRLFYNQIVSNTPSKV